MHHAGNSSGVVDGAAAVLLASPEYATKQGWTPRAKVLAFCNMGDCPSLMLNAPVPAAKRVPAKACHTYTYDAADRLSSVPLARGYTHD